MKTKKQKKYLKVSATIEEIIRKAKNMEEIYERELSLVHPIFEKSATNLLHYLAFRTFNIDRLQLKLMNLGLPSLSNIESHVMRSLFNLKNILHHLLDLEEVANPKGYVSFKKSNRIMRKNNKLLFGYKSKKRRTRIMVTLPTQAAKDPLFVRKLIMLGMNCARINCAHGDPEIWAQMVDNIQNANKKLQKKCKIAMDLAGPKLRSGQMISGPKVIKIKPRRDDLGNIIQPAHIWIIWRKREHLHVLKLPMPPWLSRPIASCSTRALILKERLKCLTKYCVAWNGSKIKHPPYCQKCRRQIN